MNKRFADLAIDLPVKGLFTYSIPPELEGQASPGKRALVPFGRRRVTGYIVGLKGSSSIENTKAILDILDERPIFDSRRLAFFRWFASYYFAPLGEALGLICPAGTSIKSFRHLRLTEKGEGFLQSNGEKGDIEKAGVEILRALKKRGGRASLDTLVKGFKRRPVHSIVENLKKEGLISEEILIKGGAGAKIERVVSILSEAVTGDLGALARKRPLQARILDYLKRNGSTALGTLRKELGSIDRAVKSLEAAGLVKVKSRELRRSPIESIRSRSLLHEPNAGQARALEAISRGIRSRKFSPFLLYGVTGSGKTLVYLKAAQEAIDSGRGVIYLVPEITLTPWPAAYLEELFPGRVAVVHSGLSDGERYDEWRRILRGEADIVVGTRSALFSPLKDPGLIIVDEEHDPSYKQEEGIRYNARDAALMLAKHLDAAVVLGSATPSVETFYNAKKGKLTLLTLSERVPGARLPDVELMDMRGVRGAAISERLGELLKETVSSGHQAILFLNRRGFSNFLICRDCGHTFRCLNCTVSLTFHKGAKLLRCHYCDFATAVPEECPSCRGRDLHNPGLGTEKVEEEVRALLPEARVGRMDRDTTRRKGAAARIIEAMEDREVDILVGTQMVSKGHHFPGATLVGIISGDTSLNIPDFRSAERTFQLIAQASGRCGRGDAPGVVLVQTLNPGHYCLRAAVTHDYEGFFEEELRIREEVFYPPFTRLCNIRIEGLKEDRVARSAALLGEFSRGLQERYKGIMILGPAPSLISRLRGRFRWQLLIKARDHRVLNSFVSTLIKEFESRGKGGVTILVDMDPVTVV